MNSPIQGRNPYAEIDQLLATEVRLVPRPTDKSYRILLGYPDIYENGIGNLAISTLYRKLLERGDCLVDRTYSSPESTKEILKQTDSAYFGWETKRPYSDFDVITFSISFEELEPFVLEMLDLGRIPPRSGDRTSAHPLVIAGGTTVNYNPEPLADFIDAFFIGDCETAIHEIADASKAHKLLPKAKLLEKLAGIKGIYVPSFYEVEYDDDGYVSRWIPNNSAAPEAIVRRVYTQYATDPSYSVFINQNSIYHELSFSLEFARGCIYACNFCQYGMMNRSPRWMSIEDASKIILEKALPVTNNIKLFYEAMTHEYLDTFLATLEPLVDQYKLELRLGAFTNNQVTDTVARVAAKGGQRGITVAPEAAAGKMRTIAGKEGFYKDEQVLETARLAAKYHIRDFGLYLLIGLPGETDDDIRDLAGFIAKVRSTMVSHGNKEGVLEVHINPVFLKPLTTFQWAAMEKPQESMRKLKLLVQILHLEFGYDVLVDAKSKAEIGAGYLGPAQRFGGHDIVVKTVVGTKMNWTQPILSRGDRRIGKVLWTAYELGNTVEAWNEALAIHRLDGQKYFEEKEKGRRLPWFFLDNHVSGTVLQRRWEQVQGVVTMSKISEREISLPIEA